MVVRHIPDSRTRFPAMELTIVDFPALGKPANPTTSILFFFSRPLLFFIFLESRFYQRNEKTKKQKKQKKKLGEALKMQLYAPQTKILMVSSWGLVALMQKRPLGSLQESCNKEQHRVRWAHWSLVLGPKNLLLGSIN